MAACLQDHGRAKIVGERSFGKGTVQNVIPVESGKSSLKLTIATYWRPSGKNIHWMSSSKDTDEWGVKPDPRCEIKLDKQQTADWQDGRRKRDTQPTGDKQPGDDKAAAPASRNSDSAGAASPLEFDPQLKRAVEVIEQEFAAPAIEPQPA